MTAFPSIATQLAGAVRRRVPLRDYQQKGKDEILAAWAAGHQNVMAVFPTGAGKTVMMADIVADHTGGGTVLFAHRRELVYQISKALNEIGVRFRLIAPKKIRQLIISKLLKDCDGPLMYDANAKVGVAGVDTLVNVHKKPEHAAWMLSVTLWVHDEHHHCVKDNTFHRAIERFPREDKRGLGFTATPARTDGKGLGRHADGLVDFMVMGPPPRYLIDEGFLSPFRIWTTPCRVHYEDVPIGPAGEYVHAKLVAAEDADDGLVGDIVATYKLRAPGKRAICFVSSLKRAQEVAERFQAAGYAAEAVDGKTDDDLRQGIMDRLESGALNVLVNVGVVGEGVDIPAVEVVILGTKTASWILYSQWIGRGLRLMLSPEEKRGYNDLTPEQRRAVIAGSVKPYAIILDHCGNVVFHGGPPDMARQYTLDRREGRGSGSGEVAPYRICANKGYSEPRGGWQKWRAAGWTVKQMEEHGHISLSVDAIPCGQPYERIHKACPYCGFEPDPQSRREIEHVDGDLQELDEETLNAIRNQVQQANQSVEDYRAYLAGKHAPVVAQMSHVKKHAERLDALERLRGMMGCFGGYWKGQGDNDSQLQRRFYHYYGIDVLSAQALKRQEADALCLRILTSLSRLGIVGLPTTAGEQR